MGPVGAAAEESEDVEDLVGGGVVGAGRVAGRGVERGSSGRGCRCGCQERGDDRGIRGGWGRKGSG